MDRSAHANYRGQQVGKNHTQARTTQRHTHVSTKKSHQMHTKCKKKKKNQWTTGGFTVSPTPISIH